MKCFYHITNNTNPYENIALEQMLLEAIEPGQTLLYLWQNQNTVVIGRNQNMHNECNLSNIFKEEGKIARRLSGGGAVYHDLGNQNFTFLAAKDTFDTKKHMKVIAHAVKSFGINAELSGRNDITVSIDGEEKKFSGNAFYNTQKASFHHGTLLLSVDMQKMAEFLTPNESKLESKGVKSVKSRVINLTELNSDITPKNIQNALISALQDVYMVKPEEFDVEALDKQRHKELTNFFADHAFWAGSQREFDAEFGKRFSFGELIFKISISNEDKMLIGDSLIYSDAMDTEWIKRLNTAIIGCECSITGICDAIKKETEDKEICKEICEYLETLEELDT